jgi:hypothetical protein
VLTGVGEERERPALAVNAGGGLGRAVALASAQGGGAAGRAAGAREGARGACLL